MTYKKNNWRGSMARLLGALLLASVPKLSLAAEPTANEGHEMAAEGAWCWFADPRALHHQSADGSINKTYVGYIDTHGNIKAMQVDFNAKTQQEVLVRSYFQPDDHDNPTFLVLPDDRVMVFYSRHTDEPCFYYRITRSPGDLATLGEEKKIETKDNTTYPSPFILSDDPTHIYLCWRGIKWHPTIAKLSLPDKNGDVAVVWGPRQMVQSTGDRPYAKYQSNGKDKILMAYTTGHPDPEWPNDLYFNYINVNTMQLEDVEGNVLSSIADGPLAVNKTDAYAAEHPAAVVDHSGERDWVWQVVPDTAGNPVIAMVRISRDKKSHNYYQARWTGKEWRKSFVAHAGGHFHQTPGLEMCYSGGMAIDPANTDVAYCSVPVEGQYGRQYEIEKVTLAGSGEIASVEAVTHNSRKGNARPYIIPNSEGTPLRLGWMHGDYYDWIVSNQRPQGYATAIHTDFEGFTSAIGDVQTMTVEQAKMVDFNPKKDLAVAIDVPADVSEIAVGRLRYSIDSNTLRPQVAYKKRVYKSTNPLATADAWRENHRATDGKWYAPKPIGAFRLTLTCKGGTLKTFINGRLDQTIKL